MTESGIHFIQDYLRCQKYFFWRYVRHLAPKHPATALIYGQAVHAALAYYYSGHQADLEGLLRTFWEEMQKYSDIFMDAEMFDTLIENGRQNLTAYHAHYSHETGGTLQVETEHQILLPNNTKLTGRLDRVYQDSTFIRIQDHKTTGWSIPMLCQTFSVSDQATAYLYLWNKNHPTMQATCVEFNILRKYKSVNEFYRHPVYKTDADLERFEKDTEWNLMEILSKTSDPDARFVMNTNSCYLFNKPCPYLDLCKGAAYEGLIGTLYVLDETSERIDE